MDYIYVDLQGRDLGGYVEEARRAVQDQVKLPPGYHIEWSVQFEYLERAATRLCECCLQKRVCILNGKAYATHRKFWNHLADKNRFCPSGDQL